MPSPLFTIGFALSITALTIKSKTLPDNDVFLLLAVLYDIGVIYAFACTLLIGLALLAYIGFGTVALKRGRGKPVRVLAFGAALCTFAYIVAVALTHDPWPPGALFVEG